MDWSKRDVNYDVKAVWERESNMTDEERRKRYRCGKSFVTLDQILPWPVYVSENVITQPKKRDEIVRVEPPQVAAPPQEATPPQVVSPPQEATHSQVVSPPQEAASPQVVSPPQEAAHQVVPHPQDPHPQEAKQVSTESTPQSHQTTENQTPKHEEKATTTETQTNTEVKEKETPHSETQQNTETKDPMDIDDKKCTKETETKPVPKVKLTPDQQPLTPELFELHRNINRKLSTWHGDITRLEIDAVVNAANNSLLGGGGIDGAIHSAAGGDLRKECYTLNGCPTGNTKTTRGYRLPAKYILHTVGPIGENKKKLRSCYQTCLEECVKHNIKTVAFCGISTGIFGYPLLEASIIACKTVRKWMENPENLAKIDRIIFCTFLEKERVCYQHLLVKYFPVVEDTEFIQNYKANRGEESEEELSSDDSSCEDVSPPVKQMKLEPTSTHVQEKPEEKKPEVTHEQPKSNEQEKKHEEHEKSHEEKKPEVTHEKPHEQPKSNEQEKKHEEHQEKIPEEKKPEVTQEQHKPAHETAQHHDEQQQKTPQ
jgi:O-acetyl-ADP-ribose deacetylase (regulator of RNase III)